MSSNINFPSEVAALREEKEEAEKKVLAVMKNMQQKDERITLLQVQLGLRLIPRNHGQAFKISPQVQLETALERVSALEEEAQPHKTEEVTLAII